MWRVLVGSLLAVFVSLGPAWAVPTDVSTVGVLGCPFPTSCQTGESLVLARDFAGDLGNPEGASFNDHYSFVVDGPVDMAGKAFAINVNPAYNIESLTFELFDPTLTSLGSFSVPDGDGAVPFAAFAFSNLVSGAYTLLVSGLIPAGIGNGLYLLEADFTQGAVSQVPLPPAVFLFLSALVGMFSLTQMRKRTPVA